MPFVSEYDEQNSQLEEAKINQEVNYIGGPTENADGLVQSNQVVNFQQSQRELEEEKIEQHPYMENRMVNENQMETGRMVE
jgi:hypothetical protein